MQSVNSINTNQIYLNKLAKPQTQVAFKGETPDLEALREKQDEFIRMSENADESGVMGKVTKFASKAIGVAIAFVATKACLGKAADMITAPLAKGADKVSEKMAEKATENSEKVVKLIDKVKSLKIDQIVVNVIAGGAALGVALKDFGLVKKPVSEQTEGLVNNAIDKVSSSNYNVNEDPLSGSYDEPDFEQDEEF